MINNKLFIGHKLRLVRNFFGYSFEDVGNYVSATRQYIQQIESGAKYPSEEIVNALSIVLNVLPEFFFSSENQIVSEEQCYFRKLQTTPVSIKNQALSQATFLEMLANELDGILDLPDIKIPNSSPANIAEVEEIAGRARNFWGLGSTAPIENMIRVVENAGIIVCHFKGLSEKVDAFSMSCRRPLIVRNPSKESVCRIRFDIAHECGHLIMHQGIMNGDGDKKKEDEANRFASAFLLPRVAFIQEFPRAQYFDWNAIFKLKLRWKVSASAIMRRAYDLNIIDAVAYRRANIYLSKTGQMRREKYDDRYDLIQKEEPELIYNSLKIIQTNAPELINRICSNMKIKKEILEHLLEIKLPYEHESYGTNVIFFNKG
jgi:Zn-dependent peptidase ImmA (M78 family)/DNA-binding XRE family transcriptional regulator